jgi:hypothetical protein
MTEQGSFEFDWEKFDPKEGRARKKAGMEKAAQHRNKLLEHAREVAERIALSNDSRTCTADDVQRVLIKQGIKPKQFGNAAGSLFKNGKWEFIRWIKSQRVSNHSRLIAVWKFRGVN